MGMIKYPIAVYYFKTLIFYTYNISGILNIEIIYKVTNQYIIY